MSVWMINERERVACAPFQELHNVAQSTISRSPQCAGNQGSICPLLVSNQTRLVLCFKALTSRSVDDRRVL